MPFNHQFNKDDVFLRNVTVGLLDLLNKRINIKYVTGPETSKEVDLPFFYDWGMGDASFLQDFYAGSENPDCYTAEGNADVIPRGIIRLESIGVDSASITNKYVRGTYVEEKDGKVESKSAFWIPLPLRLSFAVEVICDNVTECMKVIQETLHEFWRSTKFNVTFKGFRVPCNAGLSEDYGIEKNFEFSHDDDEKPKVTFTIEMETYQPIIDESTERFRGNLMQSGIDPCFYIDSNLTEKLNDQIYKEPDFKAPYGYDENGDPIKPGASL